MDRGRPIEQEQEVFEFLMSHKDDFVGIDVANDEAFSAKPYASWYQEAKAAGLGLTCHAGRL
jgi:adenosine deaminase